MQLCHQWFRTFLEEERISLLQFCFRLLFFLFFFVKNPVTIFRGEWRGISFFFLHLSSLKCFSCWILWHFIVEKIRNLLSVGFVWCPCFIPIFLVTFLTLPHLSIDVPPNGFFDKKKGYFTTVPEMIPEFIVPDLTDFKVKFLKVTN